MNIGHESINKRDYEKLYDWNISFIYIFLNQGSGLNIAFTSQCLNLPQLNLNLERPNLDANRELLCLLGLVIHGLGLLIHGLVRLLEPLGPLGHAHPVRKQLHLHLHLAVVVDHGLLVLKRK